MSKYKEREEKHKEVIKNVIDNKRTDLGYVRTYIPR